MTQPLTPEWYEQVREDVVDPAQRIIDSHHHLWPVGSPLPYGLSELKADVASGHRVEHTIFVECRTSYRSKGPSFLKSVGETEFVSQTAACDPDRLIAGIVAHTELADASHLDTALDAHLDAGG